MKVALCQVDPTVGDLPANAERLVAGAAEAVRRGADLVVLPELALTGYPPFDLLTEPDFLAALAVIEADVVRRLGAEARGAAVAFGTVLPAKTPDGKRLHNGILLAEDGAVIARRAKSLLPTYDVFDEARWFQPATSNEPVAWRGRRLGLSVCEDVWNDETFWPRRLYGRDPVAEQASAGVDLLVNLSASPYHRGKIAERERMLAHQARRHGVPLVACNQVGGADELVFDGSSVALDAEGRPLARGASFAEDLVVVDVDEIPEETARPGPAPTGAPREVREALVLGVADYFRKTGFQSALLGLSGGIDSALVAALAAEALGPDRVEAVLLPSRYSSDHSLTDASELARRLGVRTTTLPIEAAHAAVHAVAAPRFAAGVTGLTDQNVQARLRGLVLMAVSNASGALLLATSNKSELAVGYSTLYGDLSGALGVIGDCTKTTVRELAEDFNAGEERIPRSILAKPPSAELAPDQRDEDDLPPYGLLDRVVEGLVERRAPVSALVDEGLPEELVRDVRRRLERSEYKRRQAPPILRVTPRAFGPGRLMPIARGAWLP